MTDRAITGYHRDDAGDWVAELECGHAQHVRHEPPFQWREWVLRPETRAARIGTPLRCPLCDRAEPSREEQAEAGGDPACWAGIVCPECGGVAGDGTGHRPGCPAGAGA